MSSGAGILKREGFTLLEIMIVVAVIGFLATLAVPNIMRSREKTFRSKCTYNLRYIEAIKKEYAFYYVVPDAYEPKPKQLRDFEGISKEEGRNPRYSCPKDHKKKFLSSYSVGALNEEAVCEIDPTHRIPPQ